MALQTEPQHPDRRLGHATELEEPVQKGIKKGHVSENLN